MLGQLGSDTSLLPFDTDTLIPLLFWIVAILTMTLGNTLALLQNDIRRMLAYSSVAHGGYMLMGIVIASSLPDSVGNSRFRTGNRRRSSVASMHSSMYLVAYALDDIRGASPSILYLSWPDRQVQADRRPRGGRSVTSGGRQRRWQSASSASSECLSRPASLASSCSSWCSPRRHTPGQWEICIASWQLSRQSTRRSGPYYYLRVIGVMYLRTPLRPLVGSRPVPTLAAAVVLAIGTIVFGLYPQPLASAARRRRRSRSFSAIDAQREVMPFASHHLRCPSLITLQVEAG